MVDDAARARRQTRAPSTKRASDGRGCQPSAGTRPRRRLWTWRRHALARRAWLAGHGGRLLCSGTSSRAVDGLSCWDRCRRAHRLDRERSRDLDGGAGALRSRCLLVRPRGRLRGRHGGADGERRRSGRDLVPGRTPPDRSQDRSCHGCGKSGASLSRGCGRCARFQCVGVGRRRGASARRRRHWCRCSDPRAPPDLSHSGDAQQRYPKS